MSGQIEDYEVLEVIGTGSFGTCYKVRNRLSGKIYVWKAIDYGKMTEEKKQLLVSEVNLLSELNHPHIVRYYSRILHRQTTTIYIIMEWCQGGDLASLIQQYKSKGTFVEEVFVWRVLYQTGRALQACHSHLRDVTVLHRDIKPANVFLDSHGNVKLGDFGLARILDAQHNYSETIVGTPYYMSPEVIKGNKYDRKSDIWALGCLIYELCALNPPFLGSDMKQLAIKIRDGRFDAIPSNYSKDLQRIIELMLSVEHQFRPTIEMILHHPTVVLNVTTKSSFKFTNKKDRVYDKTSLSLVSEKIKSLSSLDREPEEVSEATFQEKWMTKLEALKQREANVRTREDKLMEKERALLKREKYLMIIERVMKEKLARAEVYLHQCKENRSTHSSAVFKAQKYKIIEDLDTSLSADPGDTSILPTSAKIDPEIVPLPSTFVRSASERRPKQVHFDVNKKIQMLPNIQEAPKKVLSSIQNSEQSKVQKDVPKKIFGETQEVEKLRLLGAVPKKLVGLSENKSIKPILPPRMNWIEERNVWLENKRASYLSVLDKENMDQQQHDLKEVKKRLSKISLFSKKQGIR